MSYGRVLAAVRAWTVVAAPARRTPVARRRAIGRTGAGRMDEHQEGVYGSTLTVKCAFVRCRFV